MIITLYGPGAGPFAYSLSICLYIYLWEMDSFIRDNPFIPQGTIRLKKNAADKDKKWGEEWDITCVIIDPHPRYAAGWQKLAARISDEVKMAPEKAPPDKFSIYRARRMNEIGRKLFW